MARAVKCRWCSNMESDREKVTKVENKGYYHSINCYEEYLKKQAFIDEENKKLDDLYQYIKKLHGIPDEQAQPVLKGVMWRIQELRNGNDIFKGKVEKKYRQGVEYDLLLESYKFKEKDIQWFIGQILGGSVTTKDVNACLSIALKGLSEAWRQRQLKKKREEEKIKSELERKAISEINSSERQVDYSKVDNDILDISDFFD